MKIVVLVRTLNEERNIDNFCKGYAWADKIIVVDGGSYDKTIELAKKYPNVSTHEFNQRLYVSEDGSPTDYFYNPEPSHQNHAINLSEKENPDFVIVDDCDCWPNKALRENARKLIENNRPNELFVYRLYLWQNTGKYFPKLNITGQTMWGWDPNYVDMRCKEEDPSEIAWYYKKRTGVTKALSYPYVLLHHSWPDDEAVAKKIERYKLWGRARGNPLDTCGPLANLPAWATE